MKVERVRSKDGKVELMAKLDKKEVAKEMERIANYEIAKHNYKMGRFDEDPVEFLIRHLGADEASFVFDEGIMRHRTPFALTAAEVDVIGKPVYKCLEHANAGAPFVFHLVCVPVPEFELESYESVAITLPAQEVKTAEVDEEIQKMAQAAAVAVTDDSHDVVVKGDKIELAMETTQDGKKVKPLCTDGREYNTGTLAMPDDFDEAIIGMKVGETKSFTFEGPELELGPDGKPIMEEYATTVTVKRIIDMQPPALDDAWAKTTMPGVKSLEDLRKKVTEKLQSQHEDEYNRRAQMLAGNELAKRLKGEISDLVYGVAVKEAREQLTSRLRDENISLEDYLKKEGIEKDQLNNVLLMQVRAQLTRQFALNAYAKHAGLVAEEEDIEAFFESIAPGKAGQALRDFRSEGRMYAARCAALRLKASKELVAQASVNTQGAARA